MVSEQAQQLLGQAQMYQQQMQNVVVQKETLKMQQQEIEIALGELAKAAGPVYRISGPILIKAAPADIEKDLKEKQELITIRLKTLEKGETKIKEKIEEIRSRITQNVGVDDVAG